MTIFEKVNEVLKDQSNSIFTTSEIKSLCYKKYSLNKSSVIPSDYCYNRTNKGIGTDKNILIYLGFGEYRYVGSDYKYEGWVYHREKGSKEDKLVGQWKNGVYVSLIEETTTVEAGRPSKTLSNLQKAQIESLYQEYLELLEVELGLLGCSPTELRHLIGRIGEFKCALATNGRLTSVPNQHGFDVISAKEKRISVKTTAQASGFISINSGTVDFADELMVVQFRLGEFVILYHGPIKPALDLARVYNNKYELDISKIKKLKVK